MCTKPHRDCFRQSKVDRSRETHTQQGDLTSPLLFLQNKKGTEMCEWRGQQNEALLAPTTVWVGFFCDCRSVDTAGILYLGSLALCGRRI
jgi:hypothetical protein